MSRKRKGKIRKSSKRRTPNLISVGGSRAPWRNSKIEKGTKLQGLRDSYEVVEFGPRGAHGSTFLVKPAKEPSKLVLAKIPNADWNRNSNEVENWLDHVQHALRAEINSSLRRLTNVKCVAKVLDYGLVELTHLKQIVPVLFIVQEYIKGEELSSWLIRKYSDKDGKFKGIASDKEFFLCAQRITETLGRIHEREVVHGDIWPNNIMVKDGDEIVWVDLGQSFFVDRLFDQWGNPDLSHPYSAPERMDPDRRWDIGADIYALGGVFHYLATGNPPPKPIKDEDELKQRIVNNLKANGALYKSNAGIADIIAHCLRYARDRRLPHTEAVLRDLATFDPLSNEFHMTPLALKQTFKKLRKEFQALARDRYRTYSWIVAHDLRILQRHIRKMAHGLCELAGDHEHLVSGVTRFLGQARKGDLYLAISTPELFAPSNLGVNGRFLTMNGIAAQRGVTIRRIFVFTPEQEASDPNIAKIMEAHSNLCAEMKRCKLNTEDQNIQTGGFFTGFCRVDSERLARIKRDGHLFSLWCDQDDRESILLAPVYSEKGGQLVQIRFWANPNSKKEIRRFYDELLKETLPISKYKRYH